MKYPTLSIVIPCYNEEKLIANNFKHILEQSVLPEEVIFVDNNSTDNSLKVAQSFSEDFKNKGIDFKVLEEKDNSQKQVLPRILGFKEAKSNLIGIIDIDSKITKKWVEIAKREFSKNEKLCSLTGPFNFEEIDFFSKINLFFCFILYKYTKYFYLMWGCNGVFKKDAYFKMNGLNDYWNMHKELKLKYIYDDNFLSEVFKLFGDVKFSWGLKAVGEARDQGGSAFDRLIDQQKSFFKVKKYAKKYYKNLKNNS